MKIEIYRTSKDSGERIEKVENIKEIDGDIQNQIILDENKRYQKIIGFGGAFTEAGGYTLASLSEEEQNKVVKRYFDSKDGLNYTFCRTHINSCDFSLGNYANDETEDDTELKDFTLERDHKYLIPFIKKALNIKEDNLKIFASPWSPPAWMKTNNQMNNGGSLKEEYSEIWAKYFAKYIKEYQKEGINIWGVSIQNEPLAVTPWDNCIYTPEQERDFVKVLGPEFEKQGLSDKKIIIWDHNKDKMVERVDGILSDEEANKYVWGVGFHWYGEDDSKSVIDDSMLTYTHEKYGKNLVFTEGCNPLHGAENFIGEWWTGEKYASHIINDLNHWTVAWTDWNMILDEKGGPNHVGNYCDAPVIIDTKEKKVHYNSPYYYMGHFSKFILPNAERIYVDSNIDGLAQTAFINVDGTIVLVVLNRTEDEIDFSINLSKDNFKYSIDKHSIITFKIKK